MSGINYIAINTNAINNEAVFKPYTVHSYFDFEVDAYYINDVVKYVDYSSVIRAIYSNNNKNQPIPSTLIKDTIKNNGFWEMLLKACDIIEPEDIFVESDELEEARSMIRDKINNILRLNRSKRGAKLLNTVGLFFKKGLNYYGSINLLDSILSSIDSKHVVVISDTADEIQKIADSNGIDYTTTTKLITLKFSELSSEESLAETIDTYELKEALIRDYPIYLKSQVEVSEEEFNRIAPQLYSLIKDNVFYIENIDDDLVDPYTYAQQIISNYQFQIESMFEEELNITDYKLEDLYKHDGYIDPIVWSAISGYDVDYITYIETINDNVRKHVDHICDSITQQISNDERDGFNEFFDISNKVTRLIREARVNSFVNSIEDKTLLKLMCDESNGFFKIRAMMKDINQQCSYYLHTQTQSLQDSKYEFEHMLDFMELDKDSVTHTYTNFFYNLDQTVDKQVDRFIDKFIDNTVAHIINSVDE